MCVYMNYSAGVMYGMYGAQTEYLSRQLTDASRLLQVHDQPGLQTEYQARQGYIMRCYHTETNQNEQNKILQKYKNRSL